MRLRRRHPATAWLGDREVCGPWTVVEELFEIDVLAFGANAHPPNASRKVRYPVVGYEVKVSRGDMRSELLHPGKRAFARSRCHEFYFAVPRGLLKPEEVSFEEPEWEPGDFMREDCPDRCIRVKRKHGASFTGYGHYGQVACRWPRPTRSWSEPIFDYLPCETCGGKGYMARSRVEREAPTLWVPRDVGLVEVDARGCHVVKPSPVIVEPEPFGELGLIVRWVSVRPDPRHDALRPNNPYVLGESAA